MDQALRRAEHRLLVAVVPLDAALRGGGRRGTGPGRGGDGDKRRRRGDWSATALPGGLIGIDAGRLSDESPLPGRRRRGRTRKALARWQPLRRRDHLERRRRAELACVTDRRQSARSTRSSCPSPPPVTPSGRRKKAPACCRQDLVVKTNDGGARWVAGSGSSLPASAARR